MADDFRKFQNCPPNFGKRRGKRTIYGCPCCIPGNLNDLKKVARRESRVRFKRESAKIIREYCQE